ncbi:hypothetical protein CR513_14610, partial [Mucuna pruriens]
MLIRQTYDPNEAYGVSKTMLLAVESSINTLALSQKSSCPQMSKARFEKLSMGNEMGNNNTSAIKEEDNISEAEKKSFQEDTSELANGVSQEIHEESAKEENGNLPTSMAKDVMVMEETSKASNDITNELGEDTWQEDGHAEDFKGKTQTIPTDEDTQEKAVWFAYNHTASMLENDSMERDTHACGGNMEDQVLPTAEAEGFQEKAAGVVSEDATTELGKVTLREDSHKDDVKEKIQMIQTAEAKDVQEEAAGLKSNHAASMLENDLLGEDTCKSDMNVENKMHPTNEVEDVQEKDTGINSDYTRSSLENDLLKGDAHEDSVNVDHQKHQTVEGKGDPIAAGLDFSDKTSEFEDKFQEDKQDANGTDDQGKTTISASNDPLNLTNSFDGAGDEITEVRQPENSPNAGPDEAEGGNSESWSTSSLEGTEEYEKQEESCLREHLLVTYNHHLNNETSIQQDEEETTVVTLNAVNMSNNIEIQESSSVHSDLDEPVKFISEQSFLGTVSLLEDNLLDTNSHSQQIKDDVQEKEMEYHEKLCTDKSDDKDGNEFGSSLIDTSGATPDSPSTGNNTNGNSLPKVNCTTEDSQTSLLESFIVDNPLKFDHEENCKVLYEESTLSRSGSTKENSHDYKPDQCMKDSLKEYKSGMVHTCDISIGSNGDCNGERNMILDTNFSRLATNDQVEEPRVTENGVPYDANANNSNKASEESGAASEQKQKHEEGENCNNEIEETNEKPEASHVMVNTFEGTEMSEQGNSDLVAINQEDSFPLQNSSPMLHIYDYHQDNAKQAKVFTATSMPNSDWKQQTNEGKSFGSTIDNLDSSKLTVPSVDLVDDEALEKEEEYPQHAEAALSAGSEVTTSTATMSTEPCSNNSIFANGGYETRDSVTRLSTGSNPDNPNTSCQMQKSPSFNLNLRKEARPEESDQIPLLHQDKSANESLSKQTSLNSEEMPVEEKMVTIERSYSIKCKAPFIGLLKEEEEAHLLDMPQIQDDHVGTRNAVPSTSPKRKEKRKARSSFFSSCMCCATTYQTTYY